MTKKNHERKKSTLFYAYHLPTKQRMSSLPSSVQTGCDSSRNISSRLQHRIILSFLPINAHLCTIFYYSSRNSGRKFPFVFILISCLVFQLAEWLWFRVFKFQLIGFVKWSVLVLKLHPLAKRQQCYKNIETVTRRNGHV